jgi:UDP-glucose 4-epimerase
VYASSAAVYGAPQALPLDEDSLCAPTSPYGLEKLVNDQYAALYGALYGLRMLGMRYFNVYGPRQDPASPYAGVISRFASRIARDEPLTVFGDGEQTRDFIFVQDVARANVAALGSSHCGILNVGTGSSVTLLQLIDALAACSGRTPKVSFDPPAPGDIRHSAMRPERIRALLNYTAQTSLLDGLRTLV